MDWHRVRSRRSALGAKTIHTKCANAWDTHQLADTVQVLPALQIDFLCARSAAHLCQSSACIKFAELFANVGHKVG